MLLKWMGAQNFNENQLKNGKIDARGEGEMALLP